MSYKFYSPQGQLVKTKSLRDFAVQHSLPYSHVKDLNCGRMKRYRGWLSTHKSARKYRKRFLTVLVNTQTSERCIVGQAVTRFAKAHGLSNKNLYGLLNGKRLAYKNWCLQQTLALLEEAPSVKPDTSFQNQGTKPHPTFRDAVLVDCERSTALPAT